ncbi:inorganic phosphate transporter [Streptosporangium pseudovulgare]|uniref:Phosphate transporter n=1 Tax=Streptosporangium pseudovulgare TaxID=35765 RepID=A0ABQ2R8J9_9ACTN|nr:inorganic phosphate transporter [Streptosporangium pseudovulgare]GGQ13882.1 putative low-affinity inorganic phosphate transporter [Streptosporangium pseudovulgare]
MDTGPLLLTVVVAAALVFAFTNGFHDAANAVATSVATGALRPYAAVGLSAVLNFAGAFLSLEVAATVAEGIVDSRVITLPVVFAGLMGGMLWNLVTWYLGMPSSSSHALVGGLVGAAFVAVGASAVKGMGVVSVVLLPALLSPVAAMLVAGAGSWAVRWVTRSVPEGMRERGFRVGQIGSASLVALAHGTNDAQKTMGVIMLALVTGGAVGAGEAPAGWVVVSSAAAMAAGTFFGGWRIVRTVGRGLVRIRGAEGFTAESGSAALILVASDSGFPLSTMQVCCGSVVGAGMHQGLSRVRWRVVAELAVVWLVTLPGAAVLGALVWWGAQWVGGMQGVGLMFVLALVAAFWFYVAADLRPVNASNVNAERRGRRMKWEEA